MTSIGPHWRKPGETWEQFLRRRRRQTRGIKEPRCMVKLSELAQLAAQAGQSRLADEWRHKVHLWRKYYADTAYLVIPLPALEHLVALNAGDLFQEEQQ